MRGFLLLLALLSFFQLQKLEDNEENDDEGMSLIEKYQTTTSPRFDHFKPGGVFGQKKFRIKDKMKNFNNMTSFDHPDGSSFIWSFLIPLAFLIIVPFSVYLCCKYYRVHDSGTVTPTSGDDALNAVVVKGRREGTHRGVEATKFRANRKAMEKHKLTERFPKNYDAIEEVTEPSTSRQSTAPSGSFAVGDLSARLESGASTSNSTPARLFRGRRELETNELEGAEQGEIIDDTMAIEKRTNNLEQDLAVSAFWMDSTVESGCIRRWIWKGFVSFAV